MTKGITQTSLKARYELFLTKLRLSSLLVLSKTQQIIKKKRETAVLTADEVQTICVEIKNEKSHAKGAAECPSYVSFYKKLISEYVNYESLIEYACETYVELSSISEFAKKNDFGQYVTLPILRLWEHMVQMVFEQPFLLLDQVEDTKGEKITFVRKSFDTFIISCISLDFKQATLTAENLQVHDTKYSPSPYAPQIQQHKPIIPTARKIPVQQQQAASDDDDDDEEQPTHQGFIEDTTTTRGPIRVKIP